MPTVDLNVDINTYNDYTGVEIRLTAKERKGRSNEI